MPGRDRSDLRTAEEASAGQWVIVPAFSIRVALRRGNRALLTRPRSARFPQEQLSVQVESLPIFEKPAMVDPCGLNVVDGPFLWCGTKPVILGSDYFDYSLAALAIGLQK